MSNATSPYTVYTGFWVDYSHGSVFGATLTLSRSDGSLLIAFLAFFVALVGTRLWRLLCLALHSAYSTHLPRDALHHQRQAFLRNTPAAEQGLFTLLGMGKAWRQAKASSLMIRLLPLLLLAVACTVGFTLASGYSSRVAIAQGSSVLLQGDRCGYMDYVPDENGTIAGGMDFDLYEQVYIPSESRDLSSAENYARQCYGLDGAQSGSESGTLSCSIFVKRSLPPAVVDANATCPYDKTICVDPHNNLVIDTGYLDSHDDFGLNAPVQERFQYRRKIQCAPLVTEGYKTQFNTSSERSYTRYQYGKNSTSPDDHNYTAQFSNDVYVDRSVADNIFADYVPNVDMAIYINGSIDVNVSSFVPIEELTTEKGDVYLFFLGTTGILFAGETKDPWYRATQFWETMTQDGLWHGKLDLYKHDEPGSPLACTEAHQFCFSDLEGTPNHCTPELGWYDISEMASIPYQQDRDSKQRVQWMVNSVLGDLTTTGNALAALGIQMLTARSALSSGIQGPIPDNQWQLDVQHWHATSMAYLQARFIYGATGARDARLQSMMHSPQTDVEKKLCHSQKIRTTEYMSFSVFGLCVIFFLGGVIILLSIILSPAIHFLLRRRWKKEGDNNKLYTHVEWAANEVLQLQRLAHEAVGRGTWSCGASGVPVTEAGQTLGTLDLSNPAHPKLHPCFKDEESEIGSEGGQEKEHIEKVESVMTK